MKMDLIILGGELIFPLLIVLLIFLILGSSETFGIY